MKWWYDYLVGVKPTSLQITGTGNTKIYSLVTRPNMAGVGSGTSDSRSRPKKWRLHKIAEKSWSSKVKRADRNER